MKNRILTFIIGILTGAIIMTLVFLIFYKPNKIINDGVFPSRDNGQMQRPGENMDMPPEMPYDNRPMIPQY